MALWLRRFDVSMLHGFVALWCRHLACTAHVLKQAESLHHNNIIDPPIDRNNTGGAAGFTLIPPRRR